MSDLPPNPNPTSTFESLTTDEPTDHWKVTAATYVAGFAIASGIWLIWGYWLPLLVLISSIAIVWMAATHFQSGPSTDLDSSVKPLASSDMSRTGIDLPLMGTVLTVALVSVTVLAIVARWVEPIREILNLSLFGFLVATVSTFVLAVRERLKTVRTRWVTWSALGLASAGFTWLVAPPAFASVHPLFHTPVSGESIARPAILVEILDDTELGGLGTAELYLSVQSSRFPSDVQVILPVNRGSFRGCKYRFVQLPFEVQEGDTLAFDLVDDNEMTPEQEQLVLEASRAGGFCIQVGGAVLQPELDWIVRPTTAAVSEIVGQGIILKFRDSPFRNFGRATFIIQQSRPMLPHEANPIALLDSSNYSRAAVKVYFPNSPLSFNPATDAVPHAAASGF